MNNESEFDDAAEREWRQQEAALRDERLGIALRPGDDARGDAYRRIARVLREPLPQHLPENFARLLAQRVAHESDSAPDFAFRRIERWLLPISICYFVAGIGLACLLAGEDIVSPLRELVSSLLKNPWLRALAVCLALSGTLQRVVAFRRTLGST